MMKTKIADKAEFKATIDRYGNALVVIDGKIDEARKLKVLLEEYANETKTLKCATAAYRLVMKRGKPALRCQQGVSDADVAALLKKEGLAEYVTLGFDSQSLKEDFAGSAEGRKRLESLGLVLTKPQRHATVSPL